MKPMSGADNPLMRLVGFLHSVSRMQPSVSTQTYNKTARFDFHRPLPVWFYLLSLLLGILLAMLFGWCVKTTVSGSARFGGLGKAAVMFASFPDMVTITFRELRADPDQRFRVPRTNADLSDFRPVKMLPGIHVEGLMLRADEAALAKAPGWRILVGSFILDGELTHAALALSPGLEIVKVWKLTEKDIPGAKPVADKFVHGFALLKDGSVIFSFDLGVSLQRFDRCSRRIWSLPGPFDHAVSLDEREQSAWALRNFEPMMELVQVATQDGHILRTISMNDIIAANPDIDILQIRQLDDNWGNGNPRNKDEKWLFDPFHLNDVEPLPTALASRFARFAAGDLLVSARSLNLVFVVNPDTAKVKWWHSGAWRRQHDADWQPTGEITVYDNQMSRAYSRIVGISPESGAVHIKFDGRTNDFYSRIRGKHQITPDGHLLITSAQQGRAFELDAEQNLVFEMFNTKPGSHEFNYPLSDIQWFPLNAFNFDKEVPCAN
jgi:Arylsulfotransferase (ASST)